LVLKGGKAVDTHTKAPVVVTPHGRTVTVSDGKHTVTTDCESPAVAKKLAKRLLANHAMADTWVRVTEPMKHGPYMVVPVKPAA
jgi:hypothetical protein